MSSWLTDARNLTNPNTVSNFTLFIELIFTIGELVMVLFFSKQVIFLIGNKCDLEAQRDVTYEEAKQFAEENGKTNLKNYIRSDGSILLLILGLFQV